MDSEAKMYLERAENKILLAKTSFAISTSSELQEKLQLIGKTFFNDTISLAYYAIFYAAKAFLLTKGIKTSAPEEHKKTYQYFQKFENDIDNHLAEIYDAESAKAEALLKIFFDEKRKRGAFTYNVKSEANIPAAQESIDNAKKFVSIIRFLIEV